MVSRTGVATIRDVAHQAGVSTATVSRVFSGIRSVDHVLAARVRAAATAVDYVPNAAGRALRRQVSDTWAAIVPDVQNPFFTALVAAVESVAVQQGFSVMLCNTNADLDREQKYLAAAVAQRMAGIVVAVTSETHSDLGPIVRAGMASVVVDRRVHDFVSDTVLVDNLLAGRLAATHLLERGYRRPACLVGPADVSTSEDRLTGFRMALQEAGRPLADERVVRTDLRASAGEAATRVLLDQTAVPDAVFAANGPLTAGAFLAIQGLAPDGVALIGVDDDQWTRMVSPQVSVIRQPVTEIGRRAGELLAARSKKPDIPPQHILLRPQLITRGSTTRQVGAAQGNHSPYRPR